MENRAEIPQKKSRKTSVTLDSISPLPVGERVKVREGFFFVADAPQNDISVPLLFKEGLGMVDINPSQPPLEKGRSI